MTLTPIHEEQKKKWWVWHKKNPKVWELFQRFTFEAIRSGRKNYSHWAIIQRIRWERVLGLPRCLYRGRSDQGVEKEGGY